jgi:hypothetical protein
VISPWLVQLVGARVRFSDGEEIDLSGELQIRADGWFDFSGSVNDPRCGSFEGSKFRYDAGVVLPGGFNHVVHGSFGHGNLGDFGGTCGDSWDESGVSVFLARDFPRNASGLYTLAPSLRVTRSTF